MPDNGHQVLRARRPQAGRRTRRRDRGTAARRVAASDRRRRRAACTTIPRPPTVRRPPRLHRAEPARRAQSRRRLRERCGLSSPPRRRCDARAPRSLRSAASPTASTSTKGAARRTSNSSSAAVVAARRRRRHRARRRRRPLPRGRGRRFSHRRRPDSGHPRRSRWTRQAGWRKRTVVATVMSNLGFRLGMEAAGINVVETAVGDRYVLEAMTRRWLHGRRRAERARDPARATRRPATAS